MKEVNLVIPKGIHKTLTALKEQKIIPSISEGIRFCLYNGIGELTKLLEENSQVLKPNKIKNGQMGDNYENVFIRRGDKYVK